MNIQEINHEILGMRDLYYGNIISFKIFRQFIDEINKKFKLKFQKILVHNSQEPFTNIKYEGWKNKENIYSIYVHEDL